MGITIQADIIHNAKCIIFFHPFLKHAIINLDNKITLIKNPQLEESMKNIIDSPIFPNSCMELM